MVLDIHIAGWLGIIHWQKLIKTPLYSSVREVRIDDTMNLVLLDDWTIICFFNNYEFGFGTSRLFGAMANITLFGITNQIAKWWLFTNEKHAFYKVSAIPSNQLLIHTRMV